MIPNACAPFLKPHGGTWIEVADRPAEGVELVDYDDRFLDGSPRSPLFHLGRDAIWIWRERFISTATEHVVLWAQRFVDMTAVPENQAEIDSYDP